MTMLQDGKVGRFEQSFHDVAEEVRLMAAAANPDDSSAAKPTLFGRLFGRSGAESRVLQ